MFKRCSKWASNVAPATFVFEKGSEEQNSFFFSRSRSFTTKEDWLFWDDEISDRCSSCFDSLPPKHSQLSLLSHLFMGIEITFVVLVLVIMVGKCVGVQFSSRTQNSKHEQCNFFVFQHAFFSSSFCLSLFNISTRQIAMLHHKS